jgi:hypothetical protein
LPLHLQITFLHMQQSSYSEISAMFLKKILNSSKKKIVLNFPFSCQLTATYCQIQLSHSVMNKTQCQVRMMAI